jgi:hypothetical protein
MVDNIKNAATRVLAYIIGHDALGRGGRQLVSDLIPANIVTGPGSSVDGNVVAFTGAAGTAVADSGAPVAGLLAALIKAGYTTVTAPTDLDAIRAKVAGLDSAIVLIGTFSPSGGVLPGAGVAQRGECWIATSDGTIGGVSIKSGDRVTAIIDNASTSTFAANWFLEDYTDAVLSVDGQTGAISIAAIIHATSGKTTPADADEFSLVDSASSNVLKKLTWINLKAAVRTFLLGVANVWSAPQMGSITPLSVSSGLIAWDAASGNDFEATLTANAVWQFPSNASTHVGQKGRLLIKQNGTGGLTFGVASGFKVLGSASLPAILTAANAESYAAYEIIASGTVLISLAGVGG